MATTQQQLPILEINNNLVYLKDGSFLTILQTSAVNFDLLSDNEQLAIISSFAGLLNSLSFPIQIVIRSKRLDISSYINLLTKAQSQQTNPLLAKMMDRYRVFVEIIIRENEVLDKQFFVVLSVSSLELGVGGDTKGKLAKAQTILGPRTDHLVRQLSRTGLTAQILSSERLIKLFYDIYNESAPGAEVIPVAVAQAQPSLPQKQPPTPQPAPVPSDTRPQAQQPPPAPTQPAPLPPRTSSHVPYIVEELADEYGRI